MDTTLQMTYGHFLSLSLIYWMDGMTNPFHQILIKEVAFVSDMLTISLFFFAVVPFMFKYWLRGFSSVYWQGEVVGFEFRKCESENSRNFQQRTRVSWDGRLNHVEWCMLSHWEFLGSSVDWPSYKHVDIFAWPGPNAEVMCKIG